MKRRLYPWRRFLFMPAGLWLIPPVVLLFVVHLMGPPDNLPEPPERESIFRDLILFTPVGDSYRFLTLEERKGLTPLWALAPIIKTEAQVTWSFGFGGRVGTDSSIELSPGHYFRSTRCTYGLHAHRFDEDLRPEKDRPLFLPQETLNQLRPVIVAELNRRFPDERRGDRLERLLTNGASHSSLICPQNIAVILAWCFGFVAVAAVCSMFIKPRNVHPHDGQKPGAIQTLDEWQ